jgi:crotonobetainyl-CoA:carnitine CoA-transferase CaiB-like acyl-CoA transferase
MAGYRRDDLLSALEKEGVPAGPINSVEDVFNDEQVRHRGMKVDLPASQSATGNVSSVRTPISFKNGNLVLEKAAPVLGEHTEEILEELGLQSDS